MNNEKPKYDLEERTSVFGENIIELLKEVSETALSKRIINQLAGSGMSIGANYAEANGASSKRDFRNKIFICKKEAQETKFHLRMLKKFKPSLEDKIDLLWKECQEFTLIFQKIISTLDGKK